MTFINKKSVTTKDDVLLDEDNEELYIQKSIVFINSTCEIHQEIKPLIILLKRLLTETQLNSYYNGGISSYCLFHLVFSFIKMYKAKSSNVNLGYVLLELLEFYTKYFDFYKFSVNCSLN